MAKSQGFQNKCSVYSLVLFLYLVFISRLHFYLNLCSTQSLAQYFSASPYRHLGGEGGSWVFTHLMSGVTITNVSKHCHMSLGEREAANSSELGRTDPAK